MTLQINLLGPVQISQNNKPVHVRGHKPLGLLAYLLLTKTSHSRQHLVDLLFDRPQDPKASLRWTLSELRRAIGTGYILADRQQIAFNFDSDFQLDIVAFEDGQLDLYRGDFLEGLYLQEAFAFEEWLFFERERLRVCYQNSLLQRLEQAQREGNPPTVIETAHQLLNIDNLREEWHRALMQAYAQSGQRQAALAQFDLCRQVLQAEIGLEPTVETIQLAEAIRQGAIRTVEFDDAPSSLQSEAQKQTPPHNLPLHLTPFVGREQELTQIAVQLAKSSCRLLSMIGPGGIGKTRLAIESATRELSGENFRHGVYFISLAPINSPDFIVPTIAASLNISFYGQEDPQTQLLNYLQAKNMLLILDNFEHLLSGVGLLVDILNAAPQVKLLVTSRERLNLAGEWLFDVQGLLYPADDCVDLTLIQTYSAIQLFCQTAVRLDPGFTLSEVESPHIVRICQLVEGMPLGVELAASWIRTLSCGQIVREIEEGLEFMTTSLQDVPHRHRSMRAVFEHSWQLLSEEEKRVFRRMAIFRGGFRKDAALRVTDASLVILSTLLDKSFLRRSRTGRYHIHELLRQFAAEKLDGFPEEKCDVQDRHCDYFLAFPQHRENALIGPTQKETQAEIAAEIENIRAGWQWAIAQQKFRHIDRAVPALFRFYERQSRFQEGEAAFRQAIEALDSLEDSRQSNASQSVILAKLLARQGGLLDRLGKFAVAEEPLQKSLAILRRAEPSAPEAMIFTLMYLGSVTYDLGKYLEARQWLEESVAICRKIDDRFGLAYSVNVLGNVAYSLGEYSESKRLAGESLNIFKKIGDRWGIGFAYSDLGLVAYLMGDYVEAEQDMQKSLAVFKESGNLFGMLFALGNLGRVAYSLGKYHEAERRLQESLAISKEIGITMVDTIFLNKLSHVARVQGDCSRAEQVAGESLGLAKQIGDRRGMAGALICLGSIAFGQERYAMAEQQFQDSLAIRQKLGYRRGIAESLNYLGRLNLALGKHQEARPQFHEALQIAADIEAKAISLDVLIGLAELLVKEEKFEQAVDLLALTLHHPSSEHETKDRAQHLLAESGFQMQLKAPVFDQETDWVLTFDNVVVTVLDA